MRSWPVALLLLTLTGAMFLLPGISVGSRADDGLALRVMDPVGDTGRTYYVERDYDGLPQLDITQFRTYEDRGSFHALLRLDGDITVAPGFLYSMSFWDVNIVVDSGTVQIWKGNDPTATISGATVEWTGQEIEAALARSALDIGARPPNASAQFYRLDSLGEKRLETVYDGVEWKGTIPINPYDMEIPDPESDVVQSTVEAMRITEPSLDISDVRVSLDGELLDCEMVLDDPPKSGPDARYMFLVGDIVLKWSDGSVTPSGGEGVSVLSVGATVTGSNLRVTATLSKALETPFGLMASTLEWTEDGGWKGDSAPEHGSLFTGLLPFGTGMELAFTARVLPTGLVEAGIAFQGFDGEQEALVRERSDTDEDGTVSPAEAEKVFQDALASLEDGDWVHFPVVDGMVMEISAAVGTEGLIGPTDSSDRLRIEFTLSIDGGGSLHDGWRIVFPIWGHAISPEGIPAEMRSTTMEISVPEGYYIKPATLEPAQLGNHLTRDGRSIIVEGSGPEVHAMAVGGFDLQIGPDGPGDDDGTGGEGVDGPWLLYSLASIAIMLFVVALIAWWRHSGREDR